MYAIIITTVPDEGTSEAISKRLVETHIAACVNSFLVRSVYRWEGKVERANEIMMLIKMRPEDFELVAREIKALHPYTTPCIEMLDVNSSNPECIAWVTGSTERPGADSCPR